MIGPMICIVSMVISVVGAVHSWLICREAERKARVDPERVRRFVERAPLHLLEELKAKRPVCPCCGAPVGAHEE